jgi:hypothetical protein
MIYLASTRFNNDTWQENCSYKRLHNMNGVIYGTNIRIKCSHSLGALFFVIEMNNQTNKIEGIGLIRNQLVLDKKYNIYSNGDYNRYIYKGEYWLSRDKLCYHDKELVEIFELILFTGKGHLKRQSGISVVSSLLFEKWEYDDEIIKRDLKEIFIKEFLTTFDSKSEKDLECEYITINNNNIKISI